MRRYHIQDREDYHKYVLTHHYLHVLILSLGTINYVVLYALLPIEYLYYRHRIHSEQEWRVRYSQNYTTWVSSIHQQNSATSRTSSL